MPFNRAAYPADWPAISRRIRFERAQGRCEQCGVTHGARGARDCHGVWHDELAIHNMNSSVGEALWPAGFPRITTIVLTCAHLPGVPAHLPFHLHVATFAKTDEVIQLIGFFVPLKTEGFEGYSVMHDRAAREFFAGLATEGAAFTVTLPSSAPCFAPRGSVVLTPASTAPIRVRLTCWRCFGKPAQAARIAAESSAFGNQVLSRSVCIPATLTHGMRELLDPSCFLGVERTPRDLGPLAAAFMRAGFLPLERLAGSDREHRMANDTHVFAFAATGFATDAWPLFPGLKLSTPGCIASDRAGLSHAGGRAVVGELAMADDACGDSHAPSIAHYHLPGADTMDCRDEVLRSLCQACHLRLDAPLHAANARRTRRRRRNAGMGLLPFDEDLAGHLAVGVGTGGRE